MCVATFKITLTILVISVVACCLLGDYFDEDDTPDTPLSKAAHAAGNTTIACFAVIGLYVIAFIIYLIWTI